MIDSHAHLDFRQYDKDRDEVIESGFAHGMETVINIGVDLETSRRSIELAEKYEQIFAAVGIHPHDSGNVPKDYIERLKAMTEHPKVVAIGEIGLDYYRDHSPRDDQRRAFARQLSLAKELDLPVVIHIREAMEDSLKIIRDSEVIRGVLHSFAGSEHEAKIVVDSGFHISFAGPITYPKSTRPRIAGSLPLKKILTETDSPYLTPQAFRGKRNKPEHVRFVIEKLAEIFAPYTFDDVERITSLNTRHLFNLPLDMAPKIVYKIRNSLYINLTNRCSCNCYFCPRNAGNGYVAGHYLLLQKEPSVTEIISEIDKQADFSEVVFCGLGEPTLRLGELLEIAGKLKAKGHFIRLNTNGHGGLINKADLPSKLAGLVDKVSVSLNAPDADTYVGICKPDRGKEAYRAILEFIKGCIRVNIQTDISVVELPDIDIEACREIAKKLGANFRLRRHQVNR
ncbi:MAG: TatD family hydrolase [candidate division Zixibacteria bacterium]